MNLYICNATVCNHHLHYRIPEMDKLFDHVIESGHQYKIPFEQPEQIESVIAQLQRYGAVPVKEVGRNKDFSGLIFSEKPIALDAIRQGLSDMDRKAIDRALEVRKNNVIAADAQVSKLAQEAGTGVGSVELTVKEEGRPGQANDDLQDSTIQVQRPGQPKSERSKRNANK